MRFPYATWAMLCIPPPPRTTKSECMKLLPHLHRSAYSPSHTLGSTASALPTPSLTGTMASTGRDRDPKSTVTQEPSAFRLCTLH